jgi:hypothetical protein
MPTYGLKVFCWVREGCVGSKFGGSHLVLSQRVRGGFFLSSENPVGLVSDLLVAYGLDWFVRVLLGL